MKRTAIALILVALAFAVACDDPVDVVAVDPPEPMFVWVTGGTYATVEVPEGTELTMDIDWKASIFNRVTKIEVVGASRYRLIGNTVAEVNGVLLEPYGIWQYP